MFTLVFFKRVNKKVIKTFETLEEALVYASKKHLCHYDINDMTYIIIG